MRRPRPIGGKQSPADSSEPDHLAVEKTNRQRLKALGVDVPDGVSPTKRLFELAETGELAVLSQRRLLAVMRDEPTIEPQKLAIVAVLVAEQLLRTQPQMAKKLLEEAVKVSNYEPARALLRPLRATSRQDGATG